MWPKCPVEMCRKMHTTCIVKLKGVKKNWDIFSFKMKIKTNPYTLLFILLYFTCSNPQFFFTFLGWLNQKFIIIGKRINRPTCSSNYMTCPLNWELVAILASETEKHFSFSDNYARLRNPNKMSLLASCQLFLARKSQTWSSGGLL